MHPAGCCAVVPAGGWYVLMPISRAYYVGCAVAATVNEKNKARESSNAHFHSGSTSNESKETENAVKLLPGKEIFHIV